jgi:hypothetical protein
MKIHRVTWRIKLYDETVSSGSKAFVDAQKAKELEARLNDAATVLNISGHLQLNTITEEVVE